MKNPPHSWGGVSKGYFKMRIKNSKVIERRKKRLVIPAIYFILELIFMWLVLTIIELSFNPIDWGMWSQFLMVFFGIYSSFKMIHVYHRQKGYFENSEDENFKI